MWPSDTNEESNLGSSGVWGEGVSTWARAQTWKARPKFGPGFFTTRTTQGSLWPLQRGTLFCIAFCILCHSIVAVDFWLNSRVQLSSPIFPISGSTLDGLGEVASSSPSSFSWLPKCCKISPLKIWEELLVFTSKPLWASMSWYSSGWCSTPTEFDRFPSEASTLILFIRDLKVDSSAHWTKHWLSSLSFTTANVGMKKDRRFRCFPLCTSGFFVFLDFTTVVFKVDVSSFTSFNLELDSESVVWLL